MKKAGKMEDSPNQLRYTSLVMSNSDVAHLCSYPPLVSGILVYEDVGDKEHKESEERDCNDCKSRHGVSVFNIMGRGGLVHLSVSPFYTV